MPTREHMNGYMKQRRELLKAKGICVDCQSSPAKKPHVCCDFCLGQRRDRERARRLPIRLPFAGSMQL
jgi:hypothetical protein